MGEAIGLFASLRDAGNEDAEKADMSSEADPAAPSAPPDDDLETPLLGYNAHQGPNPLPPVLLAAPSENDPLLYVCRVLSIVTGVGTLLCLVVNAISLLRSFDYRGYDYRASVFVGILRCYTIIFAILVILAEIEWQVLFKFWRILEYWVCRGLFQILVAVQTRVLRRASGETKAESVLHEIASWLLFACGILYTVAGLLCLGRIKNTHERKLNWRRQAQRDLEELHRRRADLEDQNSSH